MQDKRGKILKMKPGRVATFEGLTDLREDVPLWTKAELDYAVLCQMAVILRRFRTRVRLTLNAYRCWKAGYEQENDVLEKAYTGYEGIFIRGQLGDAWALYVRVNRDYHAMRRDYLASLCQPPHCRHEAM